MVGLELRHASVDGDCDRLIYFTKRTDTGYPYRAIDLVDGDKQLALIISWIHQKLEAMDLENTVSHAIIQTGYANGRSGTFIDDNGIKRVLVPTGVKNAHPKMIEYTIGCNAEANGHGTVIVNWETLHQQLKEAGKEESQSAVKLIAFLKIANRYVGDGVANILMMEAIMRDMDYNIKDVMNIYREQPSEMSKCVVKDRTSFKTTWDETKLIEPEGL